MRNFHHVFGDEAVSDVQFLAYRQEVRTQQRRRYQERSTERQEPESPSRSRPGERISVAVGSAGFTRRAVEGSRSPARRWGRRSPQAAERRCRSRSRYHRAPSSPAAHRQSEENDRQNDHVGYAQQQEHRSPGRSGDTSNGRSSNREVIQHTLQIRGISLGARKEPPAHTFSLAEARTAESKRVRSVSASPSPLEPRIAADSETKTKDTASVNRRTSDTSLPSTSSALAEIDQLISPATVAQVDMLLHGNSAAELLPVTPITARVVASKPISITQEPDSSALSSSDDSGDESSSSNTAAVRLFREAVPSDNRWSDKSLWTEAIKQPLMDPHELWLRVVGEDLPDKAEAREFIQAVLATRMAYNRTLKMVVRKASMMRLPG